MVGNWGVVCVVCCACAVVWLVVRGGLGAGVLRDDAQAHRRSASGARGRWSGRVFCLMMPRRPARSRLRAAMRRSSHRLALSRPRQGTFLVRDLIWAILRSAWDRSRYLARNSGSWRCALAGARSSSYGLISMMRPPSRVVHRALSSHWEQSVAANRTWRRLAPRGGMGAVFACGQVTVAASRSMSKSALVSMPSRAGIGAAGATRSMPRSAIARRVGPDP